MREYLETVAVRIRPEQRKSAKALAKRYGVTMGAILREWLRAGMAADPKARRVEK